MTPSLCGQGYCDTPLPRYVNTAPILLHIYMLCDAKKGKARCAETKRDEVQLYA